MSNTGIRFDHEEFEGRAQYDFIDPLDLLTGGGSYSPILFGINHVIEQQISRKDWRITISMFLCGPISPSLHDTIRQATEEGILVVAAAGNDFVDVGEN